MNDVDCQQIVMDVIYKYLSFRVLNPKGSVQDFLETQYYRQCVETINGEIIKMDVAESKGDKVKALEKENEEYRIFMENIEYCIKETADRISLMRREK